MYMKIKIPDEYRVDAKSFIERPFFVDEINFSSSAVRYQLLPCGVKFVPGDIARSNVSVMNMFKMAAYGRPDLILNVSMAGTITHAGCVLVGVLPPLPTYPTNPSVKNLINTILTGPHAFLHANEATSVALPVPWYCNTDIATTDMELTNGYINTVDITETNGNYATIVYLVLNPLIPSTGSTTALRIVVEACFKNFDLCVPTPRYVTWNAQSAFVSGLINSATSGLKVLAGDAIDKLRGAVTSYTGLHNPNVPVIKERQIIGYTNFANTTDAPQFFEKLDPYTKFNRIVKEPIFNTSVDEMVLSNIVTKPQMIGTFKVNVNNVVGALVWCRPISPFQGGIGVNPGANSIVSSNNIEMMHAFHRGWRGDLKIQIQSVMNNKQQVKLKVIKMYNPSAKVTTAYPAYKSIANAPSHLLEFTQGGQVLEVDLPYLCRNEITPCGVNTDFEALFHGMYYIYVAQPLVISDSSPNEVEFNVYIKGGDDLTFFGYTTNNTDHSNFNLFNTATTFKAESGSIKVMNEPQNQNISVRDDDADSQLNCITRLMPTLDIRPLIRRMYKSSTQSEELGPLDQKLFTIPLNSLIGENQKTWSYSPIETISRMYYGKTVGFKFRAVLTILQNDENMLTDVAFIGARFYYLPQNINALVTNLTIVSSVPDVTILPNPYQSSQFGIPLTFQCISKESTNTRLVYEFSIPDTSFYKFMGSPNKFLNFDSNNAANELSQQDFGSIMVQINSLTRLKTANFALELFFGLTDESRFGFHTIAPLFQNAKSGGYYLGNNGSATGAPSFVLNPYTYKGNFL